MLHSIFKFIGKKETTTPEKEKEQTTTPEQKNHASCQLKNPVFMDLLREYTKKLGEENDFAPGTILNYEIMCKNIEAFLQEMDLANIRIEDVRISLMEKLRSWLRKNLRTCGITRASRHLELCKRASKYAVLMEYAEFDRLSPIQNKRDKVKIVVHLTIEEIRKISEYKFGSPILQKCADLYIFQCYTGLSYGDLYTFKTTEEDGLIWITNFRHKTQKPYYIPMFEQAKLILNKYNGQLPLVLNQTYNRMLKEITQILELDKTISSHTGRKTMATILNQQGISTKTIADILGNTQRVCEVHYVAKSSIRTHEEFKRLGIKTVSKNEFQVSNEKSTTI